MTAANAIPLNQGNLGRISQRVVVPEYDRAAVTVGIVHFGVGGFHRAHQAMYTDRVLASGETDWGICGVGVMPADRRMADVMGVQDCLYTLVLKDPDGSMSASVIGSRRIKTLIQPADPGSQDHSLPESTLPISLNDFEQDASVDERSRRSAHASPPPVPAHGAQA